MIRDRSFSLAAVAGLMALSSAGRGDIIDIYGDDFERPRRAPSKSSPARAVGRQYPGGPFGDGFDAFRIERAELKRARKAKLLDGVSVKQRAA